MAKFSTGLRTALLGSNNFKALLDDGRLVIYSGTVPLSADDALGGGNVLLCTVSLNGTGAGLIFDTPIGGTIEKPASAVWKGLIANSGTATFFRLVASDDGNGGSASTTAPRVQGTISTTYGDLIVATDNFVANGTNEFNLNYFAVTLPA